MDKVLLSKMTGGGYDENTYDFALARSRAFVLNYCNIRHIPEGLRPTVLDIAADFLKAGSAAGEEDALFDRLTALSVGDAKAEFADSASCSPDGLIAKYGRILNRYRKVGF